MNQKILAFETKHRKKNPPTLKAGDTVRVHQLITEGGKERVQIFEGLVIAQQHGGSMAGSYTVRKIGADNIAIERTFPIHLPTVVKVERLKTANSSRAKLYYLRSRPGQSLKPRRKVGVPTPKGASGLKDRNLVWEEPMAKEELEKVRKEQEEAAKLKQSEEAAKQAELEKKFSQAKAQHDETKKPVGTGGGEPGDKAPPA